MGAKDWPAFTHTFMTRFLNGYVEENQLSLAWLAEMQTFLKLREIELYAVIHRSFDVQNLQNPWVERYMDGRRQRIEDGIPYIEYDFNSLKTVLNG
jgi:Ser/Thr protein kinase RdoA (MazF antagonist)